MSAREARSESLTLLLSPLKKKKNRLILIDLIRFNAISLSSDNSRLV